MPSQPPTFRARPIKYINTDEVLTQDSHNYSLRADYVVTPAITMFGRYSGTHENDVDARNRPGTRRDRHGASAKRRVRDDVGPRPSRRE